MNNTFLFWVLVVWISAAIVAAGCVEYRLRAMRAKRAKAEESPIDLLELDRADVQAHCDKLQLRMERDRIRWPILHSAPPRKERETEEPTIDLSDGWANYVFQRPSQGLLLQFTRDSRSFVPFVATPCDDFHDSFNVHGLYWRLTGIAKMQIEQRSRQKGLFD